MVYKITALSIYELGKRSNQEDSIFPEYSPEPTNGDLFILCDGMGGHAAGEVASQTVCETMSTYIGEHPREDGLFVVSDFNAALDAAYAALDAKDTEDEKKMGTTLTFVKFHAGGCFIAHIGDSRIYHIRPSEHRILHVTRDHSLVNDLIKLGEMTPEEAKASRQKNIITRAIQPHQEARTKADYKEITDLKAGDYFYMCSDGMLEQAEDEEIVNILSLPKTDSEKIKILKGATKDNKDNHSAHLIRIVEILDEDKEPEPVANPISGQKMKKTRHFLFFLFALLTVCFAVHSAFAQDKTLAYYNSHESELLPDALKGKAVRCSELSGEEENGHEWVDLGLSVKWATCNVGASSPSEYGNYYAWGKTLPKSDYSWSTLRYCSDDSGDSFTKYNTKSDRKDN